MLVSITQILHRPHVRLQLNRLIARFPFFNRATRAVLAQVSWIINKHNVNLVQNLPLFAPKSFGTAFPHHDAVARLTLQAANQTFPFIVHFIETATKQTFDEPIPIEHFSNSEGTKRAAAELKSMFDKYGSDKATDHDYHHLYGSILENSRESVVDVLEIGLGTNYTDVASNMGSGGRPGASLRAFREFLPQARIYGADVDRRVLFEECRIKTFFVDQTKPESFGSIATQVDSKFDIIIDDGLHTPNANIATLDFACDNLKEGGWFIVEDINAAAIPVWRVITALLPLYYTSWLVTGKGGFLFVIKRNGLS